MKQRWLYQSEGGGTYWDISEDMLAECKSFPEMKLVGKDATATHDKILARLFSFCGQFNYRTQVRPKDFTPITLEEIKNNLNRFKRSKEIELHVAKRPAGAYDVVKYVSVAPYTESEYYVVQIEEIYTTKGSTAQKVEQELMKLFAKQGYFKTWKPKNGKQPSTISGQASEPVWDITYVDPVRYYFRA